MINPDPIIIYFGQTKEKYLTNAFERMSVHFSWLFSEVGNQFPLHEAFFHSRQYRFAIVFGSRKMPDH